MTGQSMEITNRKTVSDLYEAALVQGLDGFAAVGLERVGKEVGCATAEWQITETIAGNPQITRAQSVTVSSAPAGANEPIDIELQDRALRAAHRFRFVLPSNAEFHTSSRSALSVYCEHLMAAEALARKMALKIAGVQANARGDASAGLALSDRDGNVKSTTPEFVAFMKRAQHAWDGERLPFPIVWEPRLATHGMVWKTLFFRIEEKGELYQITVREDRRQPGVSEREFEIAVRVGKGMTFKEIARALDLAPSTVSTHLYNLYAKLGISRRAHLVDWLNKHPAGGR